MTVDGIRTSKGAPQFLGGGAPATAADFNAMMLWAHKAVDRLVAAIVDLDTVDDDTPLYEGMRKAVVSCPGAVFVRTSGSWVMHGTASFVDSTARDAAIAAPQTGMRARVNGVDQRYVGGAWRGPTVIAAGTLAGVSTFNIDGLTFADDYEIAVILPTASTGNSLTAQLRAVGVTDASANYYYQRDTGSAATAAAGSNAAQTNWALQSANRTDKTFIFRTVGLNKAERTLVTLEAPAMDATSNMVLDQLALWHRATTAFDGIAFAVSTGTVTGRWEVRAL